MFQPFAATHSSTGADPRSAAPLFTSLGSGMTPRQRIAKRAFDLVVAGCVLLLVLPMLLVTAVAIRLDTPGDILVRERRVSRGGRLFNLYRFRTHRSGLSEHIHSGAARFTRHSDAQLTAVGAFLCETGLESLPELLNVLRGEMSLVGPRPEPTWVVERFSAAQRERLLVPPGMIGWQQVAKRLGLASPDDLHYIRNYSLWLDIRIILLTLAVFTQDANP